MMTTMMRIWRRIIWISLGIGRGLDLVTYRLRGYFVEGTHPSAGFAG